MSGAGDTILISAITSGAVALAIEWAAKPSLEARKERILTGRRNRRAFEANLLKIRVTASTWSDFEIPPTASDEERRKLEEEHARALGQLDGVTRAMVDDLGTYALNYLPWTPSKLGTTVPTLIAQYVFLARAAQLSDLPAARKLDVLEDISAPLYTYLFGNRWHPLQRIKALLELPGVLAQHESAAKDRS